MDFENGEELLECCRTNNCLISDVMRNREIETGHASEQEVAEKLQKVYEIMCSSIEEPLNRPQKSIGGLIGGEARSIMDHMGDGGLCGRFMTKAVAYSMAVLEENATMGLIVAAPTAGSSGILPGVLKAAMEELGYTREQFDQGILNAGALGYLFMRNASVAGAEAGCQAEVGSAAAMTASALVELGGGTPEMCLNAASLALSNLLGLVCDPIAGLVEAPCQSRNSVGVANAIVCAQLSLSGVHHQIPFDEMAHAMYCVGREIPFELRETAMGGNAATPSGCRLRFRNVTGEQGCALTPLSK